MKSTLFASILAAAALASGCGANNAGTPAGNSTAAKASASGASAVIKKVYDHAIKRDCSAIPPMLTDEFRKAVGTSKDALDALCDSITDSGKVTSMEVKSESVTGDSGTVQVDMTMKDGSKSSKSERVKKAGEQWLMDS